EGRHLLVLDALRAPLALGEAAQSREALAALERDWFAPLLAALRAGRIGMLTVHVPDGAECTAFEAVRGDLRRFWRRPRRLPEYA
ncbi:MAG TPA: regulator, partial [Burkholderiales bacterium]|nr:regulator [Burkholderiales bacterium]